MSESIINGIDVSECNVRFYHFKTNICEVGNMKLGELHYLCSENPNCYFKQLKRLQEENEKLKCRIEGLEKCEDIFFQENEDNKKYRQALEEIRNEIWEQNRSCDNCPDERNGYCIGFNECAKNIIDNFLLKIDEVLNDRD